MTFPPEQPTSLLSTASSSTYYSIPRQHFSCSTPRSWAGQLSYVTEEMWHASVAPSSQPSITHSSAPSSIPSEAPSSHPSSVPSVSPTSQPSAGPSLEPSSPPSEHPRYVDWILIEQNYCPSSRETNILLFCSSACPFGQQARPRKHHQCLRSHRILLRLLRRWVDVA